VPPDVQSQSPYFGDLDPQPADRSLRRAKGTRGRADGPHDDRSRLQQQAEQAIANTGFIDTTGGPQAALVAIDNKTGQVRAMVGGTTTGRTRSTSHAGPAPARLVDQAVHPCDRAAPGDRARVDLAARKRVFTVPNSKGKEFFVVRNFESTTSARARWRTRSLGRTTPCSRRSASMSATNKIASLTQAMGIRTPVSTNYGDDARRPEGGRHAARHGACV